MEQKQYEKHKNDPIETTKLLINIFDDNSHNQDIVDLEALTGSYPVKAHFHTLFSFCFTLNAVQDFRHLT